MTVNRLLTVPFRKMEFCKICGAVDSDVIIVCEGPCGKYFPVRSLKMSTCLDCYVSRMGLFWYCEVCRIKKLTNQLREIEEVSDGPELEPPPRKVAKLEQLTLPAELWTEIFGRLSVRELLKVRLVCHRWKKLVDESPTLTGKLVLRFPEWIMIDRDYSPSNLPPAAIAVFHRVQIVTVGSWWPSFGAGLVEIQMNRCNVSVTNMLTLLQQTPNLKCLYLTDILIDSIDDGPAPVNFRLNRMEVLHIDSDCNGQNLGVFLELCPNLKDLAFICELFSEEFEKLLQKLPSYLGKIGSTLQKLQVDTTERFLVELASLKLPKLKWLTLNKCETRCRNNRALIEICRAHSALEVLDIKDVSASSETILPEIGALLPNLVWLVVKVPKAPGIQPSLESMPQLHSLQLTGSTFVYPEPTFVSTCPNLRRLTLERVTFQEPDSLRHFLTQSQNLRVLHLEECKLGYWSCLLTAIRTQKHLRRLTLRNLNVAEMGRCCVDYLDNLAQLELTGFLVHQQTMVALFTMCSSSLRELTLVGLKDTLDFEVVDVMCRKLRRLSQLTIQNCALSKEHSDRIRQSFGSVERVIVSASN